VITCVITRTSLSFNQRN